MHFLWTMFPLKLKTFIGFRVSLASQKRGDHPQGIPTYYAALPAGHSASLGEGTEAIGNLREFDVQELGQIAREPG